jgi:3-deoxy-manno-octulosonate cytidylyltransferase (CMP-KDO synthetase)
VKTAIVIPVRYGSTRFAGKPLVKIAGQTMLSRVVDIGRAVAAKHKNVTLLVATEDERIAAHCREIGADCVLTSDDCPTGSDRVLQAADKVGGRFDVLISLQGDAPFTPPEALDRIIAAFENDKTAEVVTPVVRLRWEELDALREAKKITPFSGTTAVVDPAGRALWFSKNILPAIRNEKALREGDEFSPVLQHLGLYGYRTDILRRFVDLPQSAYEKLEGLEQLRLLGNGIRVQTVLLEVDAGLAQAGIDSPEDVARAEALLARQ